MVDKGVELVFPGNHASGVVDWVHQNGIILSKHELQRSFLHLIINHFNSCIWLHFIFDRACRFFIINRFRIINFPQNIGKIFVIFRFMNSII